MYQCPNCGGNIKYDIASSQMLCGHCATQMDPYSFEAGAAAIENSYFDTIIYTCPQCAGELVCDDTEAAVFCPYCGGSTILEGRLNRAKRPSGIIPFSKTKEDCKKAYHNYMKWAIYAPSEIKDEKYIEGFRGIYVPYWSYDVECNEKFSWTGVKNSVKDSCLYFDTCNVQGQLITEYRGHNDASAGFADEVCERIEPFLLEEKKEFTPAYISGFYADIPDVDVSVYAKKSKEIAKKDVYELLSRSEDSRTLKIDEEQIDNMLKVQPSKILLFPVWFMSHRKGDKVLYATVNGQTGKVAADIPIDRKKFFLGVLLLFVPICILLMQLMYYLSMQPAILLFEFVAVALLFLATYEKELESIKIKTRDWDKPGCDEPEETKPVETAFSQDDREFEEKLREMEHRKMQQRKLANTIGSAILLLVGAPVVLLLVISYPACFGLIFAFLGLILALKVHERMKELKLERKRRNYWLVFLSVLISGMVFLWNPGIEAIFYIMAAIIVLGIGIGFSDLIFYHNTLAMREIPQFAREGGDDNA